MAMLLINGSAVRDPSSMKITKSDLSSSDAGRDINGLMHANKLRDANGNIVSKTSIGLAWVAITPAEASAILSALQTSEYFTCTYTEPSTNASTTKTFYVGDREIPVKQWMDGNKLYEQVACTIIER